GAVPGRRYVLESREGKGHRTARAFTGKEEAGDGAHREHKTRKGVRPGGFACRFVHTGPGEGVVRGRAVTPMRHQLLGRQNIGRPSIWPKFLTIRDGRVFSQVMHVLSGRSMHDKAPAGHSRPDRGTTPAVQ